MPAGLCNEDSCTNPAKTLGVCSTHYNRSHAATRYRMHGVEIAS